MAISFRKAVRKVVSITAVLALLLALLPVVPATAQTATAPTVTVKLPSSLTQGTSQTVTAAAYNPQDGQEYSSVRFRITVDAPGDFTSADQVTAVAAQNDPAAGQSVAFTVYEGNLVGWWGPAGGFPLQQGYDVTTTFDVTVKAGAPTGTYNVTVELVDLTADNKVIAQVTGTAQVVAPGPSTYKLTQTGLAASYTAGSLVDVAGKSQSEINAAVESAIQGLTPIKVTLATDILGETGYEAVRILPVEAGDHIQLWAKDTANNWYDINVVGWGPPTGFTLPAQYSATTEVYLLADYAGSYTLHVQLVDVKNGNKVIAEATQAVTVVAAPQVTFTFSGFEALVGGQEGEVKVKAQVANNGAIADTTPLRYRLTLTKDGSPVANLTIKYPEATDIGWPNQFHTFTTDANGQAYFGPASGFTLAQLPALKGVGVETPFRATLAAGSYTLTVELVDWTNPQSPQVLGQAGTQTFTVAQPQAPTITAQGLDTFVEGVEKAFSVSTTPGTYAGTKVRAEFEVARQGVQLTGNEVTLLYEETAQQGNPYLPLPLKAEGGVLKGSYGPAEGFPLAQATSNFKATFAQGTAGTYTVTVRLVPASGGAALAEQQFTVTVAQPQAPTVALTLPPSLTVGVAGKITAEATNPSDGLAYSSVRFRITVDAPGDFTSADQVTAVAAQGDPAAGQSVAFELDQNGNLVGWWGPAGGFQMPKGYDVTTTFDVTVKTGAPTGTYNVTVELVNLAAEPDQVLASQSGQVTVWPQDGVLDKFTLPSGGAVLNQSGAQLEIPQGAFSGAATITFKPVEDKSGLPGAGSIGQVFEVKIENVQLAQPVTLRLPLPQQAGERVRVFKLVGNRWVNLGGKVSGGYVEVSLTSFSTFTAANAPAPPTASPAPGTYTSSVKVTLSAESGATILYGLNTAPQTVYTGPITLTSSATVRAVAVKDFLTSDEATFAYTITAAGGGGGGGVVRPYVSTTDPADKATGVPVDKEIKVVFSESVSAGDSFAGIALKDASGKAVEVSTRIEGSALYIKPKAALAYGAAYTVVIPARAVKDSDGYGLSADYTFSFTTAAKEVQPPPPPPVVSFKDMASHWAAEAVGKLAGKGIVTGYPDGTFKPERQVGRAEIAAILVRALKLAPGSEQELKFKDSAAIPVWARGAIAAAVREGLIKGYPQPDGTVTFEANRVVTRTELAVLVARLLEKELGTVAPAELKFGDAGRIPAWAKAGIGVAVAKGIVTGYPDGSFRPQNSITRAEAAAMVLRLLEAVGAK